MSRIPNSRSKKKREKKAEKVTQAQKLALEVLKSVRKSAMEGGIKLKGQMFISQEGLPDLPFVFCCQPGGGYLFWIIDPSFPPMHRLYALVNENAKHIASYPMDQQSEFQEHLKQLQAEMGEE